jgi:hypothetical protein
MTGRNPAASAAILAPHHLRDEIKPAPRLPQAPQIQTPTLSRGCNERH